jgi:hypothetical protein
MSALKEFSYVSDDVITIMADIDDCPLLEIPLTELFDLSSFTIVENYLQVLQRYVIELLEDTVWMDMQSFRYLLSADFDVFYPTDYGEMIAMLKQPFQQRILQSLRHSHAYDHEFELSILISFRVHATDLPHHRLCPTASSPPPPESTTSANKRRPPMLKYRNVGPSEVVTLFSPSCVSALNQSNPRVNALSVLVLEDFDQDCIRRGDDEDEHCIVDSAHGIGVIAVQVNVFDILTGNVHAEDNALVGSTIGLFAKTTNPMKIATFPKKPHVMEENSIATFQPPIPATGSCFVDHQNWITPIFRIWTAVCYKAAIVNSNRLLLSTSMRFQPIDRGRFLPTN